MKTLSLSFFLLPVLLLAGCATVPTVRDPSGVDVSVRQMLPSEVRTHFGTNAAGDLNPFIAFGGLLAPQTQDYIVLDVTINAARTATVDLRRIVAADASGNHAADLYSWNEFKKNLQSWTSGGRDYRQLYDRALRAYMKSFTVQVNPGTYHYVVVLVGKHPMSLPVTVVANMNVDGGPARIFKFDVTKID